MGGDIGVESALKEIEAKEREVREDLEIRRRLYKMRHQLKEEEISKLKGNACGVIDEDYILFYYLLSVSLKVRDRNAYIVLNIKRELRCLFWI